jgi:tripartite ATP-independent transporter DctP family solute receptor
MPKANAPNREGRNMKNSASALLALILLAAVVGPAAAQDSTNLKIACVLDAQHPILIGARRMAEVAEKESGGRLKITVYPSSQLGGQREVLQNVQAGIVDGVIDATATLTNFVPALGVVDLPYLAKDTAAAFRLFDSPVFEQELGRPAAAAGFHIVQVWEVTFRNVYTRSRPINAVADLKGQKIRVIPSPSYIALFRALGAAPTPMAFGEVYTALQQGVIDGAENDSVTYQTTKHMEVARNLALTSHMMLANTLYISERVWQRLPDDLKAVMGKASLEARKTVTAERATRDAKALGDIRAAGINVTQPDLAPFTAVGQQTYKELTERLGPDLVARIVEAAR